MRAPPIRWLLLFRVLLVGRRTILPFIGKKIKPFAVAAFLLKR
jgi:hypothetical protein